MNAEPLLNRVARVLTDRKLEAILVGNAAAALRGAPVTTVDFDFMFRKTPANLKKLKAVARELGAEILRPYYPVSEMFRVINDDQGLQLDFMGRLDGIRSFEGLRARSSPVSFGEYQLLVADLGDIIKSKRAAGRQRDLAVLEILEKTLETQTRDQQTKPSQKRPGSGK
jgi:predicted nucleotidyltransferase